VDRDAIERRDFPVGRRGYDQAAVDEHLRRVADELENLRERAPARASLSAGTSEQVRVILEAAEASAAELRADAERRATDHVAEIQRAAGGMLSRLDELERELGTLLDALRTSGERLTEGLARLHEDAAGLGVAAAGPAADEPAATAADEPAATAADESAPTAADEPAADVPLPPEEEDFAAAAPSHNGDEAGARLIALNMALSGTPREETARYLAEHFTLADPEALLDDVYERADR
jgi:DivIVA domain-containing protein